MVVRCPKRSEKTPENVQNWFKKRPKYDPKMMSKLASKNGSKMAPKWLQKWSQNGSENDLENDLKKDTKKELFHKPELARNGKREHEKHVHTRASSFGTCLTRYGACSNASEAHFGSILVPYWLREAVLRPSVALGGLGRPWEALAGSGRPREALRRSGRP